MTGIADERWEAVAPADASDAARIRSAQSGRWDDVAHVRRAVVALIVVGTLGRMLLGATLGLGVDESYEVAASRAIALSYFDHPPLSFWMIDAARRIAGSESALVVRMPFILCFALTTWLAYRLGARVFGERAGLFAAIALNLSPVFSLTSGGWALPDGPLMAAEMAAVLCLAHVLIADGAERRWMWWIGAGFFTGVAILSKYHGVFVLAGTLLFLVTSRESRRWLARPEPYVAAAIAVAFALPIVIWNAEHDWASFRFQGARGVPQAVTIGRRLNALGQNLAGQMGYILPWIWVPLAASLARALRRGPRDPRRWLLACIAILPVALFSLATLGGNPGLPHWTAPGWLLAFPLLGDAIARRRPWRWLAASAAAFVVLVTIAATHAATGWMQRLAPAAFRRGDPTYEMLEWTALRDSLAARGELGANRVVVATSWIDGGKIAHALGPSVPVLCLCAAPHQFAFTYPPSRYVRRDAIIVERAGARSDAAITRAPYFDSIRRDAPVVITRNGRPAIRLELFRASGLMIR